MNVGRTDRRRGRRTADEAPLAPHRRRWVYLLLIVYLVGAHLRLSLYSGGGSILVPMYLMVLSAGVLALMFWAELFRRVGLLMFVLLGFVVAQPVLALAPASGGSQTLRSGIQLMVSVATALIVIFAASKLEARGLRKLFFGFWAVLMVLAILESIGLRPLFDEIRGMLYAGSGRGIYLEGDRDVGLYGKVRPSALASEPSFLADSYMCMAALVFLLSKNRGKVSSWVVLGLMVGIGFTVAPSVKIVFYLLALLCWQLWPRNTKAHAGFLVISVATGAALYALYGGVVSRVIDRLGFGETGSFFGRITVGPEVALEALSRYPLLGYGIGNTDGPSPIIVQIWQDSGAFGRFPWYQGSGPTALMSNGFWWQWVFLGVLGGLAFALLASKLLAAVGVPNPMRSLVCAWIVWYAGAAFVDPVSWLIVAVFAIPALTWTVPDESGPPRRASSSRRTTSVGRPRRARQIRPGEDDQRLASARPSPTV